MAETEALCYHCLKMQPVKKFLSYNGRIYKFGKIPVCNDCLNNLFEDYVVAYKGDYKQAIIEGANLVRVGSAIFGARIYR